ncbi:regulatory protein zeste-like [Drosophila nasuta]|uniref:regulatory protein zeste-like n=1 Tax=Drosophila nasuta TaxID=42062 RepID=UPI00295F3D7A|nr:regulatory protein zeste-like [Drosophila nasuta]
MADPNSLLMPVPATTAGVEGGTTGGGMGDDERMRYIEMRKAELSYREQELAVEAKALEVTMKELELEHMRELHQLRVQLKEIEISILMSQEDQLQ